MCLSQELAPIVVKNQGLLPCFSAEVYQRCTANLTLNKGLCLHLQSTGTRSLFPSLLIVCKLDLLGFLNDRLI